jgi:hypothetical protein
LSANSATYNTKHEINMSTTIQQLKTAIADKIIDKNTAQDLYELWQEESEEHSEYYADDNLFHCLAELRKGGEA